MHRQSLTTTASLLLAAALAAWPASVAGQESIATTVVVRAIAQDAKIIGSGVGGARITIRDARSGEVLASGTQEGGTGDTQAIMGDRPRTGGVFVSDGAARFEATLELAEPTLVVIEAEGPLGTEHAMQRTTTTLLLVPGHHIVGDGVVLTLHGFTVEVVEAAAEATVGQSLAVRAKITMLCGCPTEPGGLWDSDAYDLSLDLVGEDGVVASGSLEYSGETSHYVGQIAVPDDLEPGDFELRLVAVQASRANAGMVEQPIRIRR
jgi:hypothetical protein